MLISICCLGFCLLLCRTHTLALYCAASKGRVGNRTPQFSSTYLPTTLITPSSDELVSRAVTAKAIFLLHRSSKLAFISSVDEHGRTPMKLDPSNECGCYAAARYVLQNTKCPESTEFNRWTTKRNDPCSDICCSRVAYIIQAA